MATWAVRALRAIIGIALIGSVVVQFGLIVLLWVDGEIEPLSVRIAVATIWFLGICCLQVIGISVWRLVTMVQGGTVFALAAFKYVDAVVAAIASGAVLIFGFAVVARFWNHSTPGDEVAPGLVLLICGAALVAGGVALVVYVLRALLAQAVELESTAKNLQSELDEVI